MFLMIQLGTLYPEEKSDTYNLGDTDVFTLAALDDDRESIDPRPIPTEGPEHSLLDNGDPSFMALDLDVSSAGPLCHTSARSDVSRFYDLYAALDQPMLDLDSEDDEEMGKEETVLDF